MKRIIAVLSVAAFTSIHAAYKFLDLEWISEDQWWVLAGLCSVCSFGVLWLVAPYKWLSFLMLFSFVMACHSFYQDINGLNYEHQPFEWLVPFFYVGLGMLYKNEIIAKWRERRKHW